jgi:RHS repeat-associated protein
VATNFWCRLKILVNDSSWLDWGIYTEVSIKQLQEVHTRCHPPQPGWKALPAPAKAASNGAGGSGSLASVTRFTSRFIVLAALLWLGCIPSALALRSPIPVPSTLAAASLETRVGGCDQFTLGRSWPVPRLSLEIATGSEASGYESASGQGKWVNRDPIGEAGGINLYQFVGNNQISNITRAGTLTLSGATPAPVTSVTVNGQTAQAYSDFTFARTNLALANGPNGFTNIAQNVYGVSITNTIALILSNSVGLLYDLNGNLTNDGVRSFAYDAENRLVTNWVVSAWKSEFVYDGLGRRRIERDYGWQSGGWSRTNEIHYVYDGWLVIQERDANNDVLVSYTRGTGLAGRLNESGGIGGLLARTDLNGSTYYHADGAGNVTGLIDGQQNMAARYLYGPFGRLIGQWGPMAEANEMQFSSMPRHANSGLSIYPFRSYDPSLQRWLNRDPLGEAGGLNLYRFNYNNPLSYIDPDGMAPQLTTVSFNLNGGAASAGYADQQFGQDYGIGLHGPLGPGGEIAMMTGATMVPGVGEAMDLSVLADPGSRWWELGLAGASLGLNALTDGLLPNAGGFLKAGKKLCKDATKDMIRIRHYTNSKGLKGIEKGGMIRASDQNRVFAESARRKPLSPIEAQETYGLGPGRGRNYVETDVPADRVRQRYNPDTGATELVVEGDVQLQNPSFQRR